MTINKYNYFKTSGVCKIVVGISRSLIIDIQRFRYYLIPNHLAIILLKFNGKQFNSVFEYVGDANLTTVSGYFSFLIENELIVQFESKELVNRFTASDNLWDDFSLVQNAIVDVGEGNLNYLEKIFNELSNLNCKYLQLRIFNYKLSNKQLFEVLRNIKASEFSFVQIFMPFSQETIKMDFVKLFSQNPSVGEITFYGSPDSRYELVLNTFVVNYLDTSIISETHCGIIHESLFAANIRHYTESLSFNTCLNRKVAIDKNGEIKNCPSMSKSYGNIRDTKLITVVNNPDFQKVWHIKKDDVNVCKDCEFRHICTDCRAYLEDPEDQYSKPLKCGYNPYTCEWEEWSTNPLKQKAIEYYGMQDLIKK